MLRPTLLAALIALTALTAPAQRFIDGFTLPMGTNIPGYTEQRGDWQATGGAVQADASVTFQELSNDTYTDLDCCVECIATYDTAAPTLMYIGPMLRHNGAGSSATYFMIKVQDNGSPRDGWDTFFVYYYNGASFGSVGISGSNAISPPSKQARVRLQVVDQGAQARVDIYIDHDMDGLWDIQRNAMTSSGVGTAGKVGLNGYRNAIADDLKYYNAPLYLATPPKIGTTIQLQGRGPAGDGYIAAFSFANAGIVLPGGMILPLAFGPLFTLSIQGSPLFSPLAGFTNGSTGDFSFSLNAPNLPALVGTTVFGAAITIAQGRINEVTPDVEVTLTS